MLQRRPGRGISAAAATSLPASGRQGDAPLWPLPSPTTARPLEIWGRLWATPQAVAWEAMGSSTLLMVARLARLMELAEHGGRGQGVVLGEIRQLEDRLGLSPQAMARLGWRIVEDESSAMASLGDGPRGRIVPIDIEQRIREVGS